MSPHSDHVIAPLHSWLLDSNTKPGGAWNQRISQAIGKLLGGKYPLVQLHNGDDAEEKPALGDVGLRRSYDHDFITRCIDGK